jgi:hypothetical protein
MALKRNPEKSNRALAVDAGVNERTVRNIRSGAENAAPDSDAKVIGMDGKSYPASRKKAAPSVNLPVQDQPEVKRFMRALLKLSWEQKLYLWQHVLPKYHPRGRQKETGYGE